MLWMKTFLVLLDAILGIDENCSAGGEISTNVEAQYFSTILLATAIEFDTASDTYTVSKQINDSRVISYSNAFLQAATHPSEA